MKAARNKKQMPTMFKARFSSRSRRCTCASTDILHNKTYPEVTSMKLSIPKLNGRICRFAKRQGIASIGDHTACDRHDNASGIALDRNRMLWT